MTQTVQEQDTDLWCYDHSNSLSMEEGMSIIKSAWTNRKHFAFNCLIRYILRSYLQVVFQEIIF